FDQAIALPPAGRAAFLEAACANDPALRAEVESLLACDAPFSEGDEAEGLPLLKSPLVRVLQPTHPGAGDSPAHLITGVPPHPVTLSPGHLVTKSYRIRCRIAEGGMGAVYEAEQDRPRRVVALKVVRPGLASPALLKRFAHEAQILARLHHP